MSDIVKLNIKSKNFKAVISDEIVSSEKFTEFPELLEREKKEQAHKLELENEYKKGYDEGQQLLKKELEKVHSEELLNQSKNFYNIISTFEEKIKTFEKDFHHLVINVSKRISEKIIGKELDDESKIEDLLRDNLRKIIGSNDIVVKLNPQDYNIIEGSTNKFLGSSGVTKINFEPNENIQVGGCLIESEIGNLDARVESRIEEVIKALENNFTKMESE
ncbi:MAG: FliH/SctL family protein [Melioribacteraceae bacterium]|nr:FliH/SctL family protein [Melioribacteraceae bacterium]